MPFALVLRNLWAHKLRTALTFVCVTMAIFLLCLLRSIVVALGAAVDSASESRLIVQSAVSLFVNLPLAYEGKIEQVPGVDTVCKWQWFGGIYQDPSQFFAQFACDEEELFDAYPEILLPESEREAFLANRTACIIGRGLAGRFDWGAGDRVPLLGTIFPRVDGLPWEMEIAGVYDSATSTMDENQMFFHFDYLREGLESGSATGPEGAGLFVLKLEPDVEPTTVMAEVDALFENGPQRVQTTTEAEFQRQFVTMLGSVPTLLGSIGGGVLFAIFLAVLNTMLMAARERTHDIGVMKALGFSDGTLSGMMLAESILLTAAGGAVGIGLAVLAAPALAAVVGTMIPGLAVQRESMVFAALLSLGVGLLAGLLPALRARRLNPVEALREEL